MILNDAYVTMRWNARNKTHYVSKGYQFTHMGDEFPVQVKDLTDGSKEKVPIICDICGKQFTAQYGHASKQQRHTCSSKCAAQLGKQTLLARYGVDCVLKVPEFKEKSKRTLREHYGVDNPSHSPEILKKIKQTTMAHHGVDCAFRNGPLREQAKQTMVKRYGSSGALGSPILAEKVKQTMMERYGVDHPMHSKEIKKKQHQTTHKHYGVDNPSQADEVKTKRTQTFIDRFGVDNPLRAKSVRDKIRATTLQRYGVDNVAQADEIKQKIANTMFEHYGVPCALSSPELRAKGNATCMERYGVPWAMQNAEIRAKAAETMYTNASGPSSKSQRHLAKLLGGELNYPLGQLQLDIALVGKKIDVEYDGSGHALSVRYGKRTQTQFNNAERRRDRVVHDAGWKLIRLKSTTDNLPADDVLRQLIDWLITDWLVDRSWVTVDLDTGEVINAMRRETVWLAKK